MRGVVLDDPIHFRDVETSLGYVRAKKNSFFVFAKCEIGQSSFILFLISVDFGNRHVDVVQ